ncbi:exodeoxyribonuclease VII small subunit [Oceanivirga miroungae]|uniref:Exodeoxyribonuclease VII small subunit n=1 Tax=Oceanivirga miroungae TaxID=1130046 RepID=A0A6I8M912_9FUSO|nr:exodeoxyribonuclease VII small subunit [Oceanivirga miroungae]VWL84788.1 exonuclease VII small subunit [Oceanivirga miroungae]
MSENSFESKLEKIKEYIAILEKDEISLDEAIKIYESCQKLIKEATITLDEADSKVRKIIEKMGNIEITELED